MYRALILTVRKSLEFNLTTIYRWAFIGEVADALEKTGVWNVEVFDGGVLGAMLDDYINKFRENYDLLLIYTDPHTAAEVKTLGEYLKIVSPMTKIVVYGRATIFLPQYFERWPFDAVHISGDREVVLRDYALHLSGKRAESEVTGLWLLNTETPPSKMNAGVTIPGDKWFFPELKLLPIEEYKKLYSTRGRIFEYGISASKGCPYGCPYCETACEQGTVDRRRNAEEIVFWINSSITDADPWIVQLWSSNFFHDRNWVRQFCQAYHMLQSKFMWRAVGSFRDLDGGIIKEIAGANCYEVALGVETLSKQKQASPKGPLRKLLQVVELCRQNNIKVKCLLMVGMPGQSPEDLVFTLTTFKTEGIDFRVTLYTPLQELTHKTVGELDAMDLSRYDRRSFLHPDHEITIAQQILALAGMDSELLQSLTQS